MVVKAIDLLNYANDTTTSNGCVLAQYDTFHEADITKFIAIADEYIDAHKKEINLKRICTAAGLSQR